MKSSTTRKIILALASVAAVARSAAAQEPAVSPEREPSAPRVFMDCRSRFCDFDHFRREISFVNYVRDRRDAQVHLLVTTRRTGGGGTEFTLAMIGQQEFESVDDSLQYISDQTDTFDEVRAGLTRMLKLGLVRYAARLPTAERLDVVYDPPAEAATPQVTEDPWNFWIFRIRVSGNLGGEQRQSDFGGSASLSANRTTEDWKISVSLFGWYSEDRFELADSSEITSVAREYDASAFVVRSLGAHWSVGAIVEGRTSTFTNHDLSFEAGPAIEYSLFPYAESTRRALTFIYAIELRHFDYKQPTLFDRTSETRGSHLVEVSYSVRQPFGSINTSLEGSAFLDDPSQHRLELSGRLDVRLVRGLSLELGGRVLRTKDQIFLPREDIPDEEVLLRRHELGTEYRYSARLSLSYTFGSIFNNVVNPRFD